MTELEKVYESMVVENTNNDYLDVDVILNDYLYMALWTEELDGDNDVDDFDSNSVKKARIDIEKFLFIAKSIAYEELEYYEDRGENDPSIGGNLWLARNGHGAGFFDENNDKLQDIARKMGEKYVYVEDDTVFIE